jgi:6-pyruvoyltetrahydropterin/6-carboxytetrahydropterin synthase
MSGEREPRFDVRVGKEELRFAAAHFITFGREGCEPLHGHNYRVRVSLTGSLNESGYVHDFIGLKDLVREVVEPWDHRVLLATRNPRIEVEERADRIAARCGDSEYAFPRSDVRLLPIHNTTAELLAQLISDRLLERLSTSGSDGVERLEVEVEEAPGQSACFALDLHIDPSRDPG